MPRYSLLWSFIMMLSLTACLQNDDHDSAPVTERRADIASLRADFEKYPDSIMIGQELIQAYRNQGDYDSAIAVTSRLIERDTGNAYLWNVMATLRYEMGDTLGTIHALEEAVAIYPLPDYYVALGTVYAERPDRKALRIAEGLLDQPEPNPNKADAFFIKGLYYNYAGEPVKAIAELDSALALNYNFMYAYREKAIALYHLSKFRDAALILQRAVTLQNSYDEGYYWLGKVYEKLNKKDSAIISYQTALLYDKNYDEARAALDRLRKKE